MPTATKRRQQLAPLAKRQPSASARSESGLSRRSSVGSFKTATGDSNYTRAISASEDDDDDDDQEQDEQDQDDQEPLQDQADDADDTQTVPRHHPDQAESSEESDESPDIFHKNSDTSTIHKSPPTSQDDVESNDAPRKHDRTPPRSKPSRNTLLAPDDALTPTNGRADRKSVRASHASHLTLPSQRSDAADYRDASKRLSKISTSTYNPRSRAPSRTASLLDPYSPETEMRDARYRSVSERGGGRLSRLLPAASLRDFGGSVRNSFQSQRDLSSRYASSYIEPRASSNREMLASPAAGIHHRDSDRLSIASRATARRPASIASKMLDADTQVYPGTRIRKYIEPQLNEAMRRVMKQFAGHNLQDHRCDGYPIAVFVGATAIDTGSIIQPHVSGAVSLYFGPGHPKNMASLLPEQDRTPSHLLNPRAPTPSSLSRRAELRSAITALHTVYELYRGRACAHVCIDSAYVAKAWGTWIPTWELKGWPGEDDEEEGDRERWEEEYYERRRTQRRAYDRHGARYMDLPDRRGGSGRDGYASDGGRYRDSRAPSRRREYDDRDDWLSNDPYANHSPRRATRRRGGRSNYDYPSEEDSPPRGGRRRYDPVDDYRHADSYSPDRSSFRRRPMRRAPGRRLVDEDLLRELADIRYEFARVERDRKGSAHLYLIDRSNNPADRMARAVVKSEGSLLNSQADEFDAPSEVGLHVDQAHSSDEEVLDDENEEWLETRSRFSVASRSTKGGPRRGNSRPNTRNSIISNASGRLRSSTSLPAGHLKGASRRQLDTFAEEDEDDLAADARSVRTHRSERSRKSTRAERERDEYRARQDKLDAEAVAIVKRSTTQSSTRRTAPHAGRLALAPRERGGNSSRISIDSRREDTRASIELLSPDTASRRGSIDSRRSRLSNVRSQPDLRDATRARKDRSTVLSALASAATYRGDDDEQDEHDGRDEHDFEPRPRRSVQLPVSDVRGPRQTRSRIMSEQNDYPQMDDLVPPARMWDSGSVYSRHSVDNRQPASPHSQRKGLFGTRPSDVPAHRAPATPKKTSFGLFSNRSTPSLHRSPAPEDADYQWSKTSRNKRQQREQREWHSTTAHDDPTSHWDDHSPKKGGLLSRMFGRKK